MNSARFTVRCSAAVASRRGKNADFSLVFSASKIHTTQGGIANSGREQRCGSCSTEKSLSKTENVQSATMNLPTVATSCRTTSSRKEWEEPGETTIRRTFKQPIGGAIQKRAQTDEAIDDRSVCTFLQSPRQTSCKPSTSVQIVCCGVSIKVDEWGGS
jgi:hypothetical protein